MQRGSYLHAAYQVLVLVSLKKIFENESILLLDDN